MNIVLFGAGAIARGHARAIATLRAEGARDLRLCGVCSPRADAAAAFAAEFGLPHSAAEPGRFFDDSGIDTVIVCSPSAVHAVQSRAALEAGKHVLCEIPVALSLDDALMLRDTARRHGRTLMAAHTMRFHPTLQWVREEITQQRLRPAAIVARYLFLRRANVGWTGQRRTWTDNLLWHHGGHVVDACLWLLGAERAAVASQIAPLQPELDAPLDAGLTLRTPDGALATIAVSYNSHLSAHDYVVIGRERTLTATPETLLAADGAPIAGLDRAADPLVVQDAAFFAALREGRPAPVEIDDIVPSLTVLQAAAAAAGLAPLAEERRLAASALDSRARL